MPDLLHSLLKQDIGHLRIIAELWGIELESTDADSAREELSASLLDADLIREIIDSLSPNFRLALQALIAKAGRLSWTEFARQYGDLREAGAGKRDREKLYLKPANAAEALYYRGLLARSFFDTEKGAQEFAYIPDDLFELINHEGHEVHKGSNEPLGRPASPGEKGKEILADDSILDDATTMLAALRAGKSGLKPDLQLITLLTSAKLIKKNVIQTDAVKNFLEAPRKEALKILQAAWMESDTFNELRLRPGIVCEGEWKNQPQETREFLLNLLDAIPEGKWWSLNAFVRDIKQKYADFQRPAGDYDSWFIKRESDGQYLRGFSYWDQVDGALIKFFITNILHWLGEVDLSFAEGASEPTSFRLSSFEKRKEERGKIAVSSDGRISVESTAPRVVRYQLARFCEWEEQKNKDEYKYEITAQSLKQAKEQGLKVEHLLALLAKHSDAGIPPTLVKALKRWEANGIEARVETQTVLRVSKPEILEEMRKSKAGRFLGELLSPTAAVVKSGAESKVMAALAELGLLAEITTRD